MILKYCGTLERRIFMNKKNISVTLDENLLEIINAYSKSRHISRSSAISHMLSKGQIVIIQEGAELIRLLISIEILLKKEILTCNDKENVERVCNELWQLLNLIT